jgi:uncharacterized oxidoreductase
MKTTQNTVLITGGSAGIGFAIAKLLTEKGNHVIITGRNAERLSKAAAQLQHVTAIAADVTSAADTEKLADRLVKEFPGLNMVVNNAGNAYAYGLEASASAFEKASGEMLTNYLAIIRLNELLLPLLKKQPAAAIVNVSSITAIAPSGAIPTYSASKAALHSYTQALRVALEGTTNIKVFELMPPLVNTDFSQAIGGANGIPPAAVAEDLLEALGSDRYEIQTGGTAELFRLFLSSPADALKVMNPKREAVEA